MVVKLALLTLLIAGVANFLYIRGNTLRTFYYNTPDRIVRINTFKDYEIKFADRLRSCEDAVLIKDRQLALAACDPGREKWNTVMGIYHPGELAHGELFAYNYATSGPGAGALTTIKIVGLPNATDFHTLGLEYDEATSMLFVTNHAQAGPRIEIFKLDLDAFVATHVRTLIHPLLRIPNSIQLLHGGRELYVSNDHHFTTRDHPLLSKLETYLGPPIASIVHLALDPADSYAIKTARVVARQAFANGVALLNDTTLAAASSSGAAVHLYNIEADRALTHKAKIDVPFLPDNVEIKDDKTLLITGHPHIPTLTKFAASRHICNNPERLAAATDKEKHVCETNTGLSWASEWSEENGLRHLFVESTYGSSATTLYDTEHKFGLIAGLYAKGLFTWRD